MPAAVAPSWPGREGAGAQPPAVDLRDVFCLHPGAGGAVAALRGLTLRVERGERVVVHGPNGSGKTTMLRVLAGEQPASAGTVRVDGTDLAGADERTRSRLRSRRLGLVDQSAARTLRPELDVLDNVALQLRLLGAGRRAARERAGDVLARLGLAGLATRSPATLSGGEAQRVCVCAALVHGPAVVLADEPTGELDPAAADAVYDLLGDAVRASGAALVVVSHDDRASRVADRVVRIRDGRLSEQWSPSDPGGEVLVVDDRGWLRLPERLRAAPGGHGTSGMRPVVTSGGVLLRPAGPGAPPGTAPERVLAAAAPSAPLRDRGPVARLVGVGKRYGERVVLAGLDLDVRAGVVTVVRGRSGAGKSTLLRLLVGLERPDEGSVAVAGTDLAGLGRAGLAALRRSCCSVVTQAPGLAETLDARGNLELARAARGLPDAPDEVGHWVGRLGLEPLRGRPVRLLSGGERQRVAVARSLVVAPALVVLDEPSSSLDEAGAERLAAVLAGAAAAGTAVVLATHDPVLTAAAGEVHALR